MPSLDKQGVEFDDERLIDVEVEGEIDSDEELQRDYGSEIDKDFSSSIDYDDPEWTSGLVTSSEEDVDGSLEEDLDVENDDQDNPELEDSGESTDGMVGKPTKPLSDDEFADPNRHMKRACHFMMQVGKSNWKFIKFSKMPKNSMKY